MRFIFGLKKLFSKWIYALIIISFLVSWFFTLLGIVFFPEKAFFQIIRIIISVLFGFNCLLFIFSFFKSLDKVHYIFISIAFITSNFFLFVFDNTISILFEFFYTTNLILNSLFAFILCIDYAINIDNYLTKKDRNIIFRIIFWINIIFFIMEIFTFFFAIEDQYQIFRILLWVNIVFLLGLIVNLIINKKIIAYFALFLLLIFLYILYRVVKFYINSSGYIFLSYILDLILFIYIIGSLFNKKHFFKEKMKYLRIETIILLVIIMKFVIQGFQIISSISGINISINLYNEDDNMILFIIFIILFEIYGLIKYKIKNGKSENNIINYD